MDILIQFEGVFKNTNDVDQDDLNNFSCQIPVTFTGINIGPEGLNNVSVKSAKLNGINLTINTLVSIHSYKQNVQSKDICGELLTKRPVYFRSENGNTNNTLAFSFVLESTDINLDLEDPKLEIVLRLYFTETQPLEVQIKGTVNNLEVGELHITEFKRTTSKKYILINLLGLLLLVSGLFIWNTKFNKDIYNPRNDWTNVVINMITGSLVTFLGLSMGKLKAWIATLTNFISVYKYPELHLNLQTFRILSTRMWTMILCIVILASSFLVYMNLSYKVKLDNHSAIYDLNNSLKIKTKRIYRDDLVNRKDTPSFNFGIICNVDENIKKPYVTNYINSKGKVKSNNIKVKYYRGNNNKCVLDTVITMPLKLNSNNLFGHDIDFNEIICKSNFEPEFEHKGLIILTKKDVYKKVLSEIIVRDKKLIELKTLKDYLDSFKQKFDSKDRINIYRDRTEYINTLKKEIISQIGPRGLVKFEDIKKIIEDQLNQITNTKGDPKKKIIERNILLTSFLRSTSGYRNGTPSEGDIKSICSKIKNIMLKNYGWRQNRSLIELLLEIQVLDPGSSSDIIHNLIVTSWIGKNNGNRNDKYRKICEYLAVCVLKENEDISPLSNIYIYILNNYQGMKDQQNDLYNLIIDKIELGQTRNDYITWNEINKQKLRNRIEEFDSEYDRNI